MATAYLLILTALALIPLDLAAVAGTVRAIRHFDHHPRIQAILDAKDLNR